MAFIDDPPPELLVVVSLVACRGLTTIKPWSGISMVVELTHLCAGATETGRKETFTRIYERVGKWCSRRRGCVCKTSRIFQPLCIREQLARPWASGARLTRLRLVTMQGRSSRTQERQRLESLMRSPLRCDSCR